MTTKILRVRRGTTAQNNNFTGLAGEITMDMENKTLRVHDGQTLGGIALARADVAGIPGDVTFDIESVPAEFWQTIIALYSPESPARTVTEPMSFNSVSTIEYNFGKQIPDVRFVTAALVCQTPEAGYSIGEIVSAFGIGSRTNPVPNTWVAENGLTARLMINSEQFWVSHKNTGATANITHERWRVIFTVW